MQTTPFTKKELQGVPAGERQNLRARSGGKTGGEKKERKNQSDVTEKLAENSVPEISDYACNQGEDKFKTDKGLNIHIGRMHKEDCLQSTPKKERVAI